jgi:hypothetical protein
MKTLCLVLTSGSFLIAIDCTIWLSRLEYKNSWFIFTIAFPFYINAIKGLKEYKLKDSFNKVKHLLPIVGAA